MGCASSKSSDVLTHTGKVVSSSSAHSTYQQAAAIDSLQKGSVHSAPAQSSDLSLRRGDEDVRTEACDRMGSEQQMVKPRDAAGDSAGSRMSVLRMGQASFGSSAGSASSDQRSPQSSFEGHEGGSCVRALNGQPALVAMYHPGTLGQRPPVAQDGGSRPVLLQAPATSSGAPPGWSGNWPRADANGQHLDVPSTDSVTASAVGGAKAPAPDEWRPGVPVPRGEFPGPPILPTDNSRCDAIMKMYATGGGVKVVEPRFDAITKLMAEAFKMPVANVAFTGGDHAYIKSGAYGGNDVPRATSFCHWVLVPLNAEMLVVPDARKDGRFKDNPYVTGELGSIVFYAAAPLVTSLGHRLGSLCVIDYRPREFDAECCNMLANFAEIVVRDTERYTAALEELTRSEAQSEDSTPFVRSLDGCSEGVLLVDVRKPRWPLLFANDGFRDLSGLQLDPRADLFFWDEFSLLAPDGSVSKAAEPWGRFAQWVQHGATFTVALQRRAGGVTDPLTIRFTPAAIGVLDKGMVPINIPGIPRRATDQRPSSFFFGTSVDGPSSDVPLSAHSSAGGSDYGSGGGRLMGRSNVRGGGMTTNGSGGAGSSGIRSGSDEHVGSGNMPMSPLSSGDVPENGVPFDDVTLGGLLGKGSFGSVFYGWWNDMTVAIKVIEHKSTPAENVAAKEEVEATLGLKLDHPNIVRTFKYANRELAPTVKAARVWRASMDRARNSVDCGGPNRVSFDVGPGGLDALGRPSTDANAAPGRPGNDPGRGARVRAQWDTSASSDDFASMVASPSTGGGNSMLSGASSRVTGRIPGLDDVPDMVSFREARPSGPRRLETWIVLELCGLGSLQSAIDEGAFRSERSVFEGTPDMHVILPTAVEIASALEYLHSNNVLHGDLTTNNVLLVENEDDLERPFSVKVSDFGLSRVHASESAISTNTFGTVTHMPPELLSEGQMSKAADVYAVGVLLWELYLSERPWAGLRPVQIILKKSQGKARLTWPAGAPAQYKALAERCMATDYKSRPTFTEVAAELAEMTEAEREGRFPAGPAFACYEQDWADSVPQPVRRSPSLPAASNAASASLPLSAY